MRPDEPDPSDLSRLFDGTIPFPEKEEPAPVRAVGPVTWERLTRGRVKLRTGFLGLSDRRTDLLGPSPHLSLTYEDAAPLEAPVDARVFARTGGIALSARYFNDAQGPADDNPLLPLAREVAGLGGYEGDFGPYLEYEDPYRTGVVLMHSVLGQVGRAYPLAGPVDWGWAVTGLAKMSQVFPNASANAAAALRLGLGNDRALTLYGGLTGNLSPFAYDLTRQIVERGKPRATWGLEAAPQVGAKLTGRIPGTRTLDLTLRGSNQWNMDTTRTDFDAELSARLFGDRATAFYGEWMRERGDAIEFGRRRWSAGLRQGLRDDLTVGAGVFAETLDFGNVTLDNFGFGGDLRWDFGDAAGNGHARLGLRTSPRDVLRPLGPDPYAGAAKAVNDAVDLGLALIEAAADKAGVPRHPHHGDPDRTPERLRYLAALIGAMTPEMREAFLASALRYADSEREREWLERLFRADSVDAIVAALESGADLLETLGRPGLLADAVTRVGRSALIKELEGRTYDIDALGLSLPISPSFILSAVQIMGNRPSPATPVTVATRDEVLKPYAWRLIAEALGHEGEPDPAVIAEELLGGLDGAAGLVVYPAANAAESIGDAVLEILRYEANAHMARLMLAAEELNALTLNGNRPTAHAAFDMLDFSFGNLDRRRGLEAIRAARRGFVSGR